MRFAQDDQMIHALARDRSDQPFSKVVLPRRGGRYRFVADAHGAKSTCDNGAINLIPIADQVTRRIIPGECLGQLARNPFRRRIFVTLIHSQIASEQVMSVLR